MSYRITGLSPDLFATFIGRSDDELAGSNAMRAIADAKPGYPCRITLADAEPGETVLLLNFEHLSGNTPYRASHAIFVREGARETASFVDAVPPALAMRLLSVRAYDAGDLMLDAAVIAGGDLDATIRTLFADPAVAYAHAHTAARGCYLARIDRDG